MKGSDVAPEIVRWEDPPPSKQHPNTAAAVKDQRDLWAPVAAQLQLSAQRWAVVHEGHSAGRASALAHKIRRGSLSAFDPAGAFDATTRSLGDGKHAVYARYLGLDDDDWGMAS